MNDTGTASTAFGRVDSDGTVYVQTADGERVIGSWQAGTPQEGLAHYERRYDDLVTEIELLSTRLQSGAADAMHTLASAQRLKESLGEASVVGDLSALDKTLDKVIDDANARAEKVKQARLEAREAAVARKNVLIAEAEQIAADATQWKAAGDRLREILEEWKTIKGVDRKTDAELWKRYAAARDAFNRRRGSHFATLDSTRKQAQVRKEELVTETESLSESTDWQTTANRLKALMAEWKTLPRASREAEDRLWKRFRAAQDHFFTERTKVLDDRDQQWREHQKQKEELLVQAEGIDTSDPKQAQARLRTIQSKWDQIGRVPREAMATLDRRLRAVEEAVRRSVDERWQHSVANPLLDQMREQVARAEHQLNRAREDGDVKRIARAQQALDSKRHFLDLAERAH